MPHGQLLHAQRWAAFVDDCVALPSTVTFRTAGEVDFTAKKKVAAVGTAASLEALQALGPLSDAVKKAAGALASKLTAADYEVKAKANFVDDAHAEEVAVGVVTDKASRHMCPFRSDQVASFTKKVDPSADNVLILCLPSIDALAAYTTGAARAHPLCQMKGAHNGFDPARQALDVVVVAAGERQPTADELREAQVVAEGQQLAARLVDTPCNFLNTKTYAAIARGLAKRLGAGVEVIQGDELQERGMEVIHAVGRAAEYESSLVILSHTPEKTKTDDVVCWCGKGIVYDTGGLQIKSGAGMCGMKRDMGGSAGILGAFTAAVRLGLPFKLHALLALADNAVSDRSLRNDDIVRCLSGKTIEINNTDAEGRLVLCDTVAYAHQNLHPTILVDMATLTGAQGIATGQHFAAVCSNDEDLEQQILKVGRHTGDQCFPVVFAPEVLLPEFDSKIADMRNSVKCRTNAQVSCAGLFIYEAGFAGKYTGKWLHIDMAYPVEVDARGTGFGASLLTNWLRSL